MLARLCEQVKALAPSVPQVPCLAAQCRPPSNTKCSELWRLEMQLRKKHLVIEEEYEL